MTRSRWPDNDEGEFGINPPPLRLAESLIAL